MMHASFWGEFAIRWTARLAVACYLARLYYDCDGLANKTAQRSARWWWTIGCLIFLVHVLIAFHFEHHWDHAAAFDATAKRTLEMTGWNSGVGLYVNEVFLCLWLADTLLWWRDFDWPRNRIAYWIVHFLFAFLMFQATFVFGPPLWKFAIPLAITALTLKRLLSVRRTSSI